MKELICIVCPKGCHLKVDEENNFSVTGNSCERGKEYGKNELTDPRRIITSSVKIEGGLYNRLPVKTDKSVKKNDIFKIMEIIKTVRVSAPVKCGDVLVENIAQSGADLISTKNVEKIK